MKWESYYSDAHLEKNNSSDKGLADDPYLIIDTEEELGPLIVEEELGPLIVEEELGPLIVEEDVYEIVEPTDHFSVKIPADNIDLASLKERFENATKRINGFVPKDGMQPLCMISGNVYEKDDENGKTYYEYYASEYYDETEENRKTYRMSAVFAVSLATEGLGNVLVEFEDENVLVEDSKERKSIAERNRERSSEGFEK